MAFVKIDRSIQDSWLWQQKPFSKGQAFIDLILLAQHKDGPFTNRRGELINGKRGSVYRSFNWLAERWGWSDGKVERYIKQLEMQDAVKVSKKRGSERTVIRIVNYSKYQSTKKAGGEVAEKWRGSDGEVAEINKNNKEQYKNDKEKGVTQEELI